MSYARDPLDTDFGPEDVDHAGTGESPRGDGTGPHLYVHDLPRQKQHGVTIGGKRYTVDENGKFHPYATPEQVTESMTESTATTGWTEDHKSDRAAADQEDQ